MANKYFKKAKDDIRKAATGGMGFSRDDRDMYYTDARDMAGRPSRKGVQNYANYLAGQGSTKATVTKRAPQKAKKVSRVRNVL